MHLQLHFENRTWLLNALLLPTVSTQRHWQVDKKTSRQHHYCSVLGCSVAWLLPELQNIAGQQTSHAPGAVGGKQFFRWPSHLPQRLPVRGNTGNTKPSLKAQTDTDTGTFPHPLHYRLHCDLFSPRHYSYLKLPISANIPISVKVLVSLLFLFSAEKA